MFWKFPSSTRIFNELQYNLQVWQGFINVSESFSYKDSLLILATSVLKPGPARRVDPGPGPPGQTRVRPGQLTIVRERRGGMA